MSLFSALEAARADLMSLFSALEAASAELLRNSCRCSAPWRLREPTSCRCSALGGCECRVVEELRGDVHCPQVSRVPRPSLTRSEGLVLRRRADVVDREDAVDLAPQDHQFFVRAAHVDPPHTATFDPHPP